MSDKVNDFLENWRQPAQVVSLGQITFRTPRLAICDPVGLSETEHSDYSMFIDTDIPVGDGKISVKKWVRGEATDIAFLYISFSDSEIAKWEPAKRNAGPGYSDEFDVDYGTVGFMSEAMRADFITKAALYDGSAFDDWLCAFIFNEDTADPDVAEIPLPMNTVFIAVTAPGGNGTYDAFIGRAPDGTIVSVAIDLVYPR
jgi:hypothetical protein